MADRIKGITVEIGGDTTGLSKALSGVNKEIKNTQSQLKDVNKLLKLDPTNTTLLEQKQKLLKQAVSETKDKLTQLKSVQDQMDAGLKNGTVTQQQYDAWQREIIETENELKNLEQQCKETDSSISQPHLKQTGSQAAGSRRQDIGCRHRIPDHGVTAPIAAIGAASLAAFNEVDAGLDIVAQKTGATGQSSRRHEPDRQRPRHARYRRTLKLPVLLSARSTPGFGLTGQALDDLSAKFIKFAQLNDTDVSTSVDNVSSVMNAFGMDAI
jgi:phage-related minor tail protein